jgi:hypothetical protein
MGSHSDVLRVGRPISSGMIASESYAKEKGVSLVDRQGVVQKVHKTLGISLTNFLLASLSLFFIPSRIVLLEASAYPLLCGYAGEL